MTYLLVAFLVVLVAPLLTGSWRLHLVGLGLQGLVLAALVAHRGWTPSPAGALLLLDLLVLRTWFVHRHLFAVMRGPGGQARAGGIPASLLTWALAGGLVLAAFRVAGQLVPAGGAEAMLVAVAAAGLLLALLILGTHTSVFAQIVGILRIEYAVALLELGAGHEPSLPIQVGLSAALLLTVLTLGAFLRKLGAAVPAQAPAEERAA